MMALVTGAAGFLGGAVVDALLHDGAAQLRCLVRPGAGAERLRARVGAGVEIVTGNLTRKSDVERAMADIDVVYHLAAAMKGSPADMFLNTVVGTKNILECLQQRPGTRLVLVSSMGVYGVSDLPARTLVTEATPLESRAHERDPYSYSKWRQEVLCAEYQTRIGFPMVTLRPGVVYGPGGAPMSSRVGVNLFGLFLHLGRRNPVPLSYVTNCADAVVCAGRNASPGATINVVDDDLPSAYRYLSWYRRYVRRAPYITFPYAATQLLSRAVAAYHVRSRGQLPAVFTPYKSAAIWKGNRFDNAPLKALGWKQGVSTGDGLRRTFEWLREEELRRR